MRKNELQARWQSVSKAKRTIGPMLRHTHKLTHSPFGRTPEGRLDFRGLPLVGEPIPTGGGYSNTPLAGAELADADFSHASWLGFDLSGSSLRNVLFRHTQFEGDTRFFETHFSHCVFDACSWRNVHFVHGVLQQTSFTGLKRSSSVHFNAALIEDCLFEGQLKGTRFLASPLRNTRFVGSLSDCTFFGHPDIVVIDAEREQYGALAPEHVRNRMAGVDWSQASLHACTITNYAYLDQVLPPPLSTNLLVQLTPAFYEQARALVQAAFAEPTESTRALRALAIFFRPDVRQPYHVAGPLDEVRALGAEGAQRYYDALVRAAQATGTCVQPVAASV